MLPHGWRAGSRELSCTQIIMRISCGVRVSTSGVFFWKAGRFVLVAEMLNSLGSVQPGLPPGLTVFSHGGRSGVVVWNGRLFVPRR